MTRITWLVPFWFAIAAQAQPYLNLDFETATRGRPWSWSVGSAGYEYTVDSSDFHPGNRSLRIQNVNAPPYGLALPPSSFQLNRCAANASAESAGRHDYRNTTQSRLRPSHCRN